VNKFAFDWFTQPKIYVENQRARDRAYDVTAGMVLDALATKTSGRVTPASLHVAFSDERDQTAWKEADILIAGRLDKLAINTMERLRFIQCTSAGVESYMPLDWLPQGVDLYNASGVHAAKVAQFGAMACLMLHEGVPSRVTAQRQHVWKRNLRPTAKGVRVLVFGAGALGGAVAQALIPFGFSVQGIGRHPDGPRLGFVEIHGPDALHSLLAQADILVLSCPLTEETRGRIGRTELETLPKGASVLNIARSAVMDYDALADLLKSGHLGGAILDVFDTEPLPAEAPWWDVPNLMVFPHVSADDPTSYAQGCVSIFAENMLALIEGRPMRNRVNPELGY
jgi:phosphoglycerate dehydrogenase-like enzyme